MNSRGFSLGVKRPGREADHSTPSSAEVKEWVELYLHSSDTPSWRGAQLKKSAGALWGQSSSFGWSMHWKKGISPETKKKKKNTSIPFF
jgi:hypothetical protein